MSQLTHREFLDSAVLARLARLQVEARMPVLGSVTGLHKSATRGSSVEFAEYRKYVPGDDIKHIDWRVYARSDRFYLKDFEADTNLRCHLVIDTSASMGFKGQSGTKFEFARKLAATLAYLLVKQGDAVGLRCFADKVSKDIPARHAPSHLKNIFDTLADIKPKGTTEIVKTIHDLAEEINQRALIIVFSDFFTDVDALLDCFQHMRFRKHDLAIFHLLDRQELDFNFDRPIRFDDMESSYSVVTDPYVVRSGYLAALNKYLATFQRGCLEFHADYQRVFLDDDYEKILAGFLLQRVQTKPGGKS